MVILNHGKPRSVMMSVEEFRRLKLAADESLPNEVTNPRPIVRRGPLKDPLGYATADIFDVTSFTYELVKPTSTRGRLEALLNAVDSSFRLIVVPFGPKIFAWLAISTIVFMERRAIGIWTFSSKEQGQPVDREADGLVTWHTLVLPKSNFNEAASKASLNEAQC